MKRLRIKGIVSQANRMRQLLSQPMTVSQRDRIDNHLKRVISDVDNILIKHKLTIEHLPAPSRRAYQFLKGVNLKTVKIVEPPPAYDRPATANETAHKPPQQKYLFDMGEPANAAPDSGPAEQPREEEPLILDESISFRGVKSYVDSLLDDIAHSLHSGNFKIEKYHDFLRQTTGRLNQIMEMHRYESRHLKLNSRELLGWFRYFDDADNFQEYVEAVRRAQQTFGKIKSAQSRWKQPYSIHLRPTASLYRWHVRTFDTRITLPTPMMAFDEEMFHKLGVHMLGYKKHMPIIQQAMLAEGYQSIAADLETLTGQVEQTQGQHYDLKEIFNRVNAEYFKNAIGRPKLTWSKTLTGRVFGHYEIISDTVMISRTLDTTEVPAYVIDHIMHHELLHKKLGITFRGHHQHAHTKLFRHHERTFKHYQKAAAFLNSMPR